MTLRKLLFGAILIGLCVTGLAQHAIITPNDALILENIPPTPANNHGNLIFLRRQCVICGSGDGRSDI